MLTEQSHDVPLLLLWQHTLAQQADARPRNTYAFGQQPELCSVIFCSNLSYVVLLVGSAPLTADLLQQLYGTALCRIKKRKRYAFWH